MSFDFLFENEVSDECIQYNGSYTIPKNILESVNFKVNFYNYTSEKFKEFFKMIHEIMIKDQYIQPEIFAVQSNILILICNGLEKIYPTIEFHTVSNLVKNLSYSVFEYNSMKQKIKSKAQFQIKSIVDKLIQYEKLTK